MKKIDIRNSESISEKKERIRIQEIAEEIRVKWARKGISDVFEILENQCILIRKPLVTTEISAFTTYFSDNFIVFLNSSFTLGHERFSAAHELGHLVLHDEQLIKESVLNMDEVTEREATVFAVEFLMPETGVKEMFYKIVAVEPGKVNYRHVIRMHHYFKVSYKAMLKRLIYLDLCDADLDDSLLDYCSLDNKDLLLELTKKEGYDSSLILPSNAQYVSKEYEEIIRSNYETGKISYGKLESLLMFIGKTPEDFGYLVSEDED